MPVDSPRHILLKPAVGTRARRRQRWRHHVFRPARQPPTPQQPGKRPLDTLIAVIALILLAPLMALIALVVRLDTPGPALFRQIRTGRCGAPFVILKFRTMRMATTTMPPTARDSFRVRLGRIQVTGAHPGVTLSGRLLRATSLDELPQLLNVLRGDMALVGPRPHMAELDTLFRPLLPHLNRRYAVTPGMTGLAQINGVRGPTPDMATMAARLRDDLTYIGCWSIWLDLRILAATPLRLLAARRVNWRWAATRMSSHSGACALPIRAPARYTEIRQGKLRRRADGRSRLPRRHQGVFRPG